MENIFSPSWYSVSALKPKLRQHVDISSHKFRGDTWYLYQDTISGRTHQFPPVAHFFISLMNGKRTVEQMWDALNSQFGDDSPNQDNIIQLLAQLHFADIISTNVTPVIEELFQRTSQFEKSDWKKKFSNPISMRFSLLDPESILNATHLWFGWMFSKLFAVITVVVFILAGLSATNHWESLSYFAQENTLSYNNLFLLWLLYPIVKLFHEFGHAIATKHWGGEVHDMGIMFLYFTPIPYVDASASTAYRNKNKRMVVSAAGIIVELLLASFALFIWLNVEPGLVKDIAFNIMLIGGISTLLFNGNPLLRYDAYYILSDAIDIPNLANRSNKYIGYLLLHYIFGANGIINPVKASGESAWFFMYSILSFCYRMFILFVIVLFISQQYFFVGLALGVWIIILQIVIPFSKNIAFVFTDSRVTKHKLRTWAMISGFLSFVYYSIFIVSVPYSTIAEGVVWSQENTQIRTNNDAFISEVHFKPNEMVKKDSVLLSSVDLLLESKKTALHSEYSQLNFEYKSKWSSDRAKRKIINEELESLKAEINNIHETHELLTIRSPNDGVVIIPRSEDLIDKFIKKGTLLGYVLNDEKLSARVLVTQDDMNLIKKSDVVDVRFVNNISQEYVADNFRIVPAATDKLPSAVLSVSGGGIIKTDPKDSSRTRSIDKYFEIWVDLPVTHKNIFVGSRVYVKFTHGEEPLANRIERWFDQLLLSQFNA